MIRIGRIRFYDPILEKAVECSLEWIEIYYEKEILKEKKFYSNTTTL